MIPTRPSRKSQAKHFQNNIPIMDGDAFVYTIPQSNGIWYFRMWVKEEGKQYRKSLATRDLDEALDLGRKLYADVVGKTASGRKFFGQGFKRTCQDWLEDQQVRVDTGLITEGRYKTIKTQVNRHIVPYVEKRHSKQAKIGSLGWNSFYDYAQYRRKRNPVVQEVTIRNEHATIGSLVKWCFRRGLLNFEKCDFEEIKIREPIRRDTFTLDEYEKLLRFLCKWVKEEPDYRTPSSNMMPLKKKKFFRDMILLAANSALRVGEMRQLKWGMVKIIKRGGHKYANFKLPAEICKNRKSRAFPSRGGEYLERLKRYSNWTGSDDYVICNNDDGKQISKTELYRM